jgi:hypothetical protein
MPNGSNQYTKKLVQAGQICYVCESNAPTLTNDIGGSICTDCNTHMQNAILEHVLKSGYRARKVKRS